MLVKLLHPDPILLDDPVRPKISSKRKVSAGHHVFMWLEEKTIGAVVCVVYRYNIPKSERELLQADRHDDTGLKIILYSIWSYKKGCGQKLVNTLVEREKDYVARIVTMSPKTEMAQNFHLRNGAKVFQVNKSTVNYEY